MTKKSLGICIGASTISFVVTEKETDTIHVLSTESVSHDGNPKKALTDYFSRSADTDISVVATGRKFKELINTKAISEPEAVEEAFAFLGFPGKYDAIASLGGENFMVYCLNHQGNITNVLTGNKCASGTGEFFLQQIRRMNVNTEQALELADQKEPHCVSGRCSVFCKSDCTHALNKGIPKGEVVSGLCKMIANKIIELLGKQKSQKILVIGGASQNRSVIHFLKQDYPEAYIPKEATYFEALGASLIGLKKESNFSPNNLFRTKANQFSFLEALKGNESRVTYKSIQKDEAREGDICLLGLDVGSTTTKAVVIRREDNALLASAYLRTNGNPVQASVDCYKELKTQISVPIQIIGLGTTGSGRHISGLQALTKGVINEIIAHAVASAYFDREVDTIFEIGGQDAKYTHLVNGTASDYAMNEACSAGTGSFLEESAKETLNIDYRDIGDIALTADNPPNFNDQCAAFISSDIKNASHEGIAKEDIVAGLVYSICMNYMNRVKGNRPVGNKVFMQGGVCYNKAVPIAMSILVNKDIIVPPEPGLMGAFGVALEVKNRIKLGFLAEERFDFDELIHRKFQYGKEFICPGGEEKCDRKCKIAMIQVEGKNYPFGGACNRYYNQRMNISTRAANNDYVKMRQKLVFEKYVSEPQGTGKKIGILKTFLTNTLYPLYYNFFTKLGFEVVLSDAVEQRGIDKMRSAFCYPAEIAHGAFQNLIDKQVDYIFLPHITEMDNPLEKNYKKICVFAQGEPYYIRSAFSDEQLPDIISPVINFSQSKKNVSKIFIEIAKQLGKRKSGAIPAFHFADNQLQAMRAEFKLLGKQALQELESDPDRFGIVLFGRPYNTFVKEANLGIPHKFASKGILIIPHDFLASEHLPSYEHMYWYNGQIILRNARFVKKHPQLFGVFVTNFSCGPDSFIVPYFRKIMGVKPSLTLELDSHSADVGVNTRIDAALDIIKNYLELNKQGKIQEKQGTVQPLCLLSRGKNFLVQHASGSTHDLFSPEVEVIIPSMGRFGADALQAVLRSRGIHAKAMPIPTAHTLKYGRSHTSCKECLPFILTTGQMVEYVKEHREPGKKTLFFMPHGSGPCRQGQYYIKFKDILQELELDDVGIFSLDDEKSYGGLGTGFFLKAWVAIVISDAMQDIEHAIYTLAVDRESALETLDTAWESVAEKLERGTIKEVFSALTIFASQLAQIPLKYPLSEAKIVSLIGEVYVRREEFSRLDLIETLADHEFVVKVAPVGEYLYYCNYLAKKGSRGVNVPLVDRWKIRGKDRLQIWLEKKIKQILATSGLLPPHLVEIEKTLSHANHLISEDLLGEAILTVGLGLREIKDEACGIISIGPFACMPSRVAEAILNKEMAALPYLHIETDGNPYPQITQSKIEIFMLQAEKLHNQLKV